MGTMKAYGGRKKDNSHRKLLSKSGCDIYGSCASPSNPRCIKRKLIKRDCLRRERSRIRRITKELITKELNEYETAIST